MGSTPISPEKNALLAVAEITHDERPTLVYNFEIAQDHNYFVGQAGAEAHKTGLSVLAHLQILLTAGSPVGLGV